jgi:allophanate hydrolase
VARRCPPGRTPATADRDPHRDGLSELTDEAQRAFAGAVDWFARSGAAIRRIDLEPFLAAGRLLYGGAFVAERHAAVGDFIASHSDAADPTVGEIITTAAKITAAQYAADSDTLERLRGTALAELVGSDALLVPTTLRQPTIAEVARDRFGANARLGLYTTFANLLDMCAVAIPAGYADGGHFGVTLLAPAFRDHVVSDLAARAMDETTERPAWTHGIAVFVIGAHRSGQPLNHELCNRGARLLTTTTTSAAYRLLALDTDPPKPGLVRVSHLGVPIEGELWEIPAAALGPFLASLPAPMMLGRVELADGSSVVGFGVEAVAVDTARDISLYGSWPAYLAARRQGPSTG